MADRSIIEVRWAAASIDEARKVSRYLVENRLIACAQIVPLIESLYLWDGQLTASQESLVLLKTTQEQLEKVQEVILSHCSYELPELLYFTAIGGLTDYIDWVYETVVYPTTLVGGSGKPPSQEGASAEDTSANRPD